MNTIGAPIRRLKPLLAGFAAVADGDDRDVEQVVSDSRQARPGCLFAAYPGHVGDGRRHIDDALRRGATAVLYESRDAPAVPRGPVPSYPIQELRHKLGTVAARFYGSPSRRLLVVGVTGTNGKTTCAHLTAQALQGLGVRSGVIGTLGQGPIGAVSPQALTTPDAIAVQAALAALLRDGAEAVAMEVSSHGLAQGRVQGVSFDVAVFTNLSRDHLDFHGDMDRYAASKRILFAAPGLRHAVVNIDDACGRDILREVSPGLAVTYGWSRGDVRIVTADVHSAGLTLTVATPQGEIGFRTRLIGRLNVPNLLAVVAVLIALGRTGAEIASVMPQLNPVPGRLEAFDVPGKPRVVVDYAHTPDALEKALASCAEHTEGNLWCVFGCGGDRDRGKRPIMGAVAERLAQAVVLTNDNPRNEDEDRIIADIRVGMSRAPRAILPDRREAIRYALRHATAADLVLIAGKGHETTQTAGSSVIAFSDREVARDLLEGRA